MWSATQVTETPIVHPSLKKLASPGNRHCIHLIEHSGAPCACQSATASFEESRVAELDRKRAARKQQVINTTGTVWPCDRCSRTCSSRIGLFARRRTHPSVTQSVVFDGALHVPSIDSSSGVR